MALKQPFRFLIFDTTSHFVVGTNNAAIARRAAADDDNHVVDTHNSTRLQKANADGTDAVDVDIEQQADYPEG